MERTGEDAALAQLHGTHAVIVDRVDGGHALKIIDVIGKPEPLHCGAFRKVLLAHQPDSWIREYVAGIEFRKYTPRTIASEKALYRELEAIRKQGYATSLGERIADAGGVAAPVFDYSGAIRASIQIVAPVTRLTPNAMRGHIAAVVDAGRRASALLGAPGSAGSVEARTAAYLPVVAG
jgi:DNA-binding IclR family transcriptional regulator